MADFPIYRRQQIEALAEHFVREHHRSGGLPLPIEAMAERMGLEIYPVPRFRDAQGGRTAALNNDVQSVTIDENAPWGHYRYALAHECGHYVLHRSFIASMAVQGEHAVTTWRHRLAKHEPQTLSDLERQADVFARCVLMPGECFSTEMDAAEARLPPGQDWFTASDQVFEAMTDLLAETFGTTQSSVVRRLRDYGVVRD